MVIIGRPMLTLFLTSVLFCQDPAPPPAPAQPAETPTPPAPPPPLDDRAAKAAADEFAKMLKGKPSMADKSKALDKLASGSHKLFVKPLAQVVQTEKSVVIMKRAAELIGNQPAAEAAVQIRAMLKNPRIGSLPTVMAELVRGLSRCGYVTEDWAAIDSLFERDYSAERVPLHEAILELVTAHKEKAAVPLLLRNLDAPVPEDVHVLANPPAEYWEARWKAWSVWKSKVKNALFEISGQRFSTAAEAKAWLKKNPLK